MVKPVNIQSIGEEVAIAWSDRSESFFPMPFLRKHSPSAENVGEHDIFGNKYGGQTPSEHPGVRITGWSMVGNYAIKFSFSDGHNTGLFSFGLLKELEAKLTEEEKGR
ncbi:MAG: DUF971 domain-containing protein [Opitutales bacterium]|nr:DUF971 domain-containing protein [Opitutales bacterium]MCH8540383.1 DUF971 domain-containing protein [Opitutales bacterium]